MKTILPISLLAVPGLAMGELPMMCLSSPPLELEAGMSLVSARIYNPLARRCTASLIFDDNDFLPVTYAFESARCTGIELASFLVPLGAPDGDAYISWQCAGQSPTCMRAVISGGNADASLELQDTGAVSCILETLQTMTTLTTVTRSSTTVVESLVSIFTSVTTSPVTQPTTTPASTPTTTPGGSLATTTSSPSSGMSSSPATAPNESDVSPTADPPPAGSQPAPAPPSDSPVDHGWADTTTPASTTATTLALAQSAVDSDRRSAFPPTSDATALKPSIAAMTVISTVTVMQTLTSLLASACSSA